MSSASDNNIQAKSYIFRVVIEPDQFEDGRPAFHAFCPALKGCHTFGHTYKEALSNIKEAVELCVEDMLESGEAIPVDPENGVIEQPAPSVVVNV